MRRIALLLVPVLVAACLDTSDASLQLDPTDANVAGAFALASINGTPLPVIASVTTTQEFDLASDTVSVTANGTWTETSVYVVTSLADNSASSLVTVIGGTYTIANQQINFVQTTGGGSVAFAGSVRGTRLTIVFGGSQFLYNRSS
jgi:hypothetical protein